MRIIQIVPDYLFKAIEKNRGFSPDQADIEAILQLTHADIETLTQQFPATSDLTPLESATQYITEVVIPDLLAA